MNVSKSNWMDSIKIYKDVRMLRILLLGAISGFPWVLIASSLSLWLKEAKDLVEGAPKEVKAGVNKKEADEIKAKLEAAGAKVELK